MIVIKSVMAYNKILSRNLHRETEENYGNLQKNLTFGAHIGPGTSRIWRGNVDHWTATFSCVHIRQVICMPMQ